MDINRIVYIDEPWKNNGGGLINFYLLNGPTRMMAGSIYSYPFIEIFTGLNAGTIKLGDVKCWDAIGNRIETPEELNIICNKLEIIKEKVIEWLKVNDYIVISYEAAKKYKTIL